jgi:enoyl-CoA hydratase
MPDEEAMSADLILCRIEDGVAVLTLDNPPLNLVTLELTRALDRALERLAGDPAVRALVLTGAGERAFCAGSDIREFPGVADDVVGRKLAAENRAYARLDDFPKPTIAAIAGLAYGGGLELAVCCDLLVVEANARLALPEIKLGVFPGSGGTVRVTRRIGEGRAKELMYFGEPIDPETALAWGLVNRVVPVGEALITARRMAAALAKGPGKALQLCKRAIDFSHDVSKDEAIERSLALSAEAFASADCQEGVRAFFEKRKPRFTHS